MRQTTRAKRAHGQIRQSQLLTTFGPRFDDGFTKLFCFDGRT